MGVGWGGRDGPSAGGGSGDTGGVLDDAPGLDVSVERSEDEAAEVGVFGAALPGCPGGGDEVVVRLACLLVGWHEGVKCGSLFRG